MNARTGRRGAFSLVEVVLALGIFATVGVALIGLLGTGLNVTRDAVADAEISMLVENVQARLTLDPEWPAPEAILFYDNAGAQVDQEEMANFRVTLTSVGGPGFQSDYFETFRVVLERTPQKQKAGIWMLQRARLAQGKPVAVP